MDATDFRRECELSLGKALLQGLRPGQHVYNFLQQIRPDIARQLAHTDADPFYENGNLPAFWKEVQELW